MFEINALLKQHRHEQKLHHNNDENIYEKYIKYPIRTIDFKFHDVSPPYHYMIETILTMSVVLIVV